MVRRRPEAEDLTQEVFLKAFKALHRYDRTRRFSSWFFKIAHNHALDYLRKTPQPTLSIDADTSTDALVSGGPSPAELTEQAKLGGALRAAIGGLRVQYREAIALRYQEDLPLEEIADVMGIPEGTVKTYLHRARQELAGEMTRRGWARD